MDAAVKRVGRTIDPAEIPASHRDLLERPLVAALTTLFPDGQPQTQPVWFSFEERCLLINTMRGFRKERNLRADRRATVLVVDTEPRVHWMEVRGLVELIDEGAQTHLDSLAGRYAGAQRYFGEVVSAELAAHEIPVLGRITPLRVVTDATKARQRAEASRPSAPIKSSPPHAAQVLVPVSHRDLLERPLTAMLSTLMPGGHPQTQPVWLDFDGTDLLVNTTRERQKGRNLRADPRATALVVDPADSGRWIEIRGDVDITEEGAVEHLDQLTRAYTRWPCYYGYVYPFEQRERETRIICRLHPRRIVCDAIHR